MSARAGGSAIRSGHKYLKKVTNVLELKAEVKIEDPVFSYQLMFFSVKSFASIITASRVVIAQARPG